jgi:hypothetical protein
MTQNLCVRDGSHEHMAHLGIFDCQRTAIGTTSQADKHREGSGKTDHMGRMGMNVHEVSAGECGVAHKARKEENGPQTQESGQIDPIQGFKPVHILNAVLASVRTHRPEGVNADGR